MAYTKKNKGVVRCIDKMGRVVIPKEIRKDLGMDILRSFMMIIYH